MTWQYLYKEVIDLGVFGIHGKRLALLHCIAMMCRKLVLCVWKLGLGSKLKYHVIDSNNTAADNSFNMKDMFSGKSHQNFWRTFSIHHVSRFPFFLPAGLVVTIWRFICMVWIDNLSNLRRLLLIICQIWELGIFVLEEFGGWEAGAV